MTNLGKTLALIAILGTVWGVAYMHDRARRYDIVAAGAGSGGSQDTTGDSEINAFIIDHQTGRVWVELASAGPFMGWPIMRVNCTADEIKSSEGCSESPAEEKSK
jgi:hypothetical protein